MDLETRQPPPRTDEGLTVRLGLRPRHVTASRKQLERTQQALDRINRLLRMRNLPPYREPNDVPRTEDYESPATWHYTFRPGMLEEFLGCTLTHAEENRLGLDRGTLDQLFETGLAGGVWLPLSFPELIPGGDLLLASSQRLREICQALALTLEIPIPLDEIPCDASGGGRELNDFFEGETGTGLWDDETGTEKELCIILYQAARLSLASGLALCFD